MYKIIKKGPFQHLMQPDDQKSRPVYFNMSEELMPGDNSYDKLLKVASDKRVFHHIAALTDIHSKPGRKNPTGSVVATEKEILPQLTDSAPNCGMRLIKTPFFKGDLSDKQLDDLFKEYVKTIPTRTYFGTCFSHKDILEISKRGSAPVLEIFGKSKSELKNTYLKGNMFGDQKVSNQELFKAIPSLFFRVAQSRLGILGEAGNHFLDLLLVEDIVDKETADKLGIQKNQYVFLLHTGSGMFGQYSSYFYMPKKKEHLSQKIINVISRATFLKKDIAWHQTLQKELPLYENSEELWGVKEGSELYKNFMIANRASANHAFANRALLQIRIEQGIEKILGKKLELPIVYDMSHISVTKEKHFGKKLWIHRNGSVRAFGPKRMKGIKTYEETGEPVFMPSSMSTPAYLGVGTDQNESTFFSAPHGTGKSKNKTSKVPTNKEELHSKMVKNKVRLYNAKSTGILEQDSSHYKNIEPAIKGMTKNGVIKPVAKMRPVSVLMA
ncbi:MAG: RtcB family protein [Candidatus Moranbacteria bacterium]|nr:RtcB family protein [Candidatus Moranbacteria bacterium]